MLLVALGTGLESRAATCNPLSVETMLGDVFVWHFTRDSTNNGTPVNINNTDKYNVSGARNKTLTVNSIISTDEGYYYCQIFRNEMLLPDLVVGACLYVYSKSKWQV